MKDSLKLKLNLTEFTDGIKIIRRAMSVEADSVDQWNQKFQTHLGREQQNMNDTSQKEYSLR